MIPTRRDLHFRLTPESVRNWHAAGPYVTHFVDAMSVFFPDGERYFIHTVRHYRDLITKPEMKKAVAAFIGQEAMHGREHEEYNRLLDSIGLPAAELEKHARDFLELLKKYLPPAAQLSVTIAQEHFTAIVAELVLTDSRMLAGADARLKALWRWHALEETEHKAVAFDVYETAMGRGAKAYALRSAGLLLTTVGFLGLVLYYQQRLMQAEPQARTLKNFGKYLKFMFIAPAMMPRLALPWLAYLRPGFHPWDQDNRYLLKEIDTLVARTEAYGLKAA
jgi:predicted metal-dependent hydrolase